MITGGPARREKTEAERDAERQADRIVCGEVLRENGWTPQDFETAQQFGFPAAVSRYLSGKMSGQGIYSRAAIAGWSETVLKLAATLKSR